MDVNGFGGDLGDVEPVGDSVMGRISLSGLHSRKDRVLGGKPPHPSSSQ